MNKSILRILPLIFPVFLVAAYVTSALEATAAVQSQIGEVADVNGHTWGRSSLGSKYDKLTGDVVALDETVGTGVDSAMTMRFIDETTLTLGASAEIIVDEMVYNPDDHENDVVNIQLGKGTFYFISGKVAKDKVTLVTPTASIGIRGTELVITVKEDGETSVGVAKGRAFMRSHRDGGGDVEIDTGHSARTSSEGRVSDPFPGVDLTGDDDVDHHIPGVAEWEDDRKEEQGDIKAEDFDFEGEGDDDEDKRFAEYTDKDYDAERDDFEEADFTEEEQDDERSILANLFDEDGKRREGEEGAERESDGESKYAMENGEAEGDGGEGDSSESDGEDSHDGGDEGSNGGDDGGDDGGRDGGGGRDGKDH